MEKILDVNLLEAMSKIARCSRASTTDSFFYDQEAIKKAARQKPEKRCSLLWICFPDGTELYPIADAFKCGSRPYENAQFFQQDERVERVSVFYELEISQKRNGVIRGNIYAVDSRWFAGLAKGPPSSDLTAAKHTPAQWSGLEKYFEIRKYLPETSLGGHLEHRRQERIHSEARRIVEKLQMMDTPNIPGTPYAAIVFSETFRAGAAEDDIFKLNDELRRISSEPAPFVVYHPDLQRYCGAKVCPGREKQKSSIKERLGQRPAGKNQPDRKPEKQEER